MSATDVIRLDCKLERAAFALDVAADIAAKYGAHLKILHVGLREEGPRTQLLEAAERSFAEAESAGAWTSDHKDWPRHLQVLDRDLSSAIGNHGLN